MPRQTLRDLLKKTASETMADNVPRMAAALAYYTTFSLAPLLIIVIGIAALVLGQRGAAEGVSQQIQSLIGKQGADAVQAIMQNANKPAQGIFSAIIGFATLLLGASGVFGELQSALNTVWGATPKTTSGVWEFLRSRFFSFAMVLGTGFLLLVSLIASAAIAAISTALGSMLPFSALIAQSISFAASLALTAGLFALILKYLPDTPIAWRHVWPGALFTAILFTIGKSLLGLYLGNSAVTSSYGAAGSLIVVLLWVYYSSILLLVGAEFTQVYRCRELASLANPPATRREPPHTASGYAQAPPL